MRRARILGTPCEHVLEPVQISIVRLGFCMNNFLVLLTLRVRLTGLHS